MKRLFFKKIQNMKTHYLPIYLFYLCISCVGKDHPELDHTNSTETAEVLFSKVDLTKENVTPKDYVANFNLYEDEFLTMHFTLPKPLIKSLLELAPNLSEEELLAQGNFQFSFIVNGKTIYVENLNTGAGTPLQKTEEIRKVVRLVTPEQIGFWGWFMWQRFMKLKGGHDALIEGKHKLSIEIKPYLQSERLIVGPLLAKGDITIEVPKIEIDENLIAVQKIKANSGWEISKDNYDRNIIETLNRRIVEASYKGININGVVVIKNNQLLIEQYFNGAKRNSLHDVRSVGKSFASSVLGIAIADNYIESEDALLKDFYNLKSFKNHSPKKDSVTLKSLLTMSSGFLGDDWDFSSPGNEENMYPTENWVAFALNLPMHKGKVIGKDYTYFTAGVVLLGDIIHRSVPDGLVAYADNRLFAPLNITNYKWQYTPQNVGNTAGGIQLRAIDFAKYGQLYKNKGKWNGKQILTADWVEKSLAKQVSQSYAGIEDGYYGYLFWNKVFPVNGKNYEVAYCSGNGGNKIFIFKDIPFVIIITASAYGIPNAHATVDKMMVDHILPAVLD